MNFVKEFICLRKGEKMSIEKLSKICGVKRRTIENWEYFGISPTLDNFNAALGAIGYELAIKKLEDTK